MGLPRKQVKCFLNNSIKITRTKLIKYKKSDSDCLFRYPWPFWIASFLITVCNIYFSYLIYYYRIKTPWVFGANIIIYWVTFFFTYISEIEKLTVDKKVKILY